MSLNSHFLYSSFIFLKKQGVANKSTPVPKIRIQKWTVLFFNEERSACGFFYSFPMTLKTRIYPPTRAST